jgi:hypothetical protein
LGRSEGQRHHYKNAFWTGTAFYAAKPADAALVSVSDEAGIVRTVWTALRDASMFNLFDGRDVEV